MDDRVGTKATPSHYEGEGKEVIDQIRDKLIEELCWQRPRGLAMFVGFCLGNYVKYKARKGKKAPVTESDLKGLYRELVNAATWTEETIDEVLAEWSAELTERTAREDEAKAEWYLAMARHIVTGGAERDPRWERLSQDRRDRPEWLGDHDTETMRWWLEDIRGRMEEAGLVGVRDRAEPPQAVEQPPQEVTVLEEADLIAVRDRAAEGSPEPLPEVMTVPATPPRQPDYENVEHDLMWFASERPVEPGFDRDYDVLRRSSGEYLGHVQIKRGGREGYGYGRPTLSAARLYFGQWGRRSLSAYPGAFEEGVCRMITKVIGEVAAVREHDEQYRLSRGGWMLLDHAIVVPPRAGSVPEALTPARRWVWGGWPYSITLTQAAKRDAKPATVRVCYHTEGSFAEGGAARVDAEVVGEYTDEAWTGPGDVGNVLVCCDVLISTWEKVHGRRQRAGIGESLADLRQAIDEHATQMSLVTPSMIKETLTPKVEAEQPDTKAALQLIHNRLLVLEQIAKTHSQEIEGLRLMIAKVERWA